MGESVSLSGPMRRTLGVLAGRMIPACEPEGLPGADDPAILDEVARSLACADSVRTVATAALARLDELGLADLPSAEADSVLAEWRAAEPEAAELFVRHVAQCYYRDGRVMTALGMEVRAPYPEGYEVEEGDWSLLDPVRARAPMYRDACAGRGLSSGESRPA